MNDRQPYCWVIEHGHDSHGEPRRSYFTNDGLIDAAYVMERAARLHGVVRPLFTERRKE